MMMVQLGNILCCNVFEDCADGDGDDDDNSDGDDDDDNHDDGDDDEDDDDNDEDDAHSDLAWWPINLQQRDTSRPPVN